MMITKERSMIDKDKRVFVYYNLHKECWSVRQGGKVVDHTHDIMLRDCQYLVGKAGRKRVLREKRKNVHAGVSGYVVDFIPACRTYHELTYNPYRHTTFVSKQDQFDSVKHSDYAVLTSGNGFRDVEGIWK